MPRVVRGLLIISIVLMYLLSLAYDGIGLWVPALVLQVAVVAFTAVYVIRIRPRSKGGR